MKLFMSVLGRLGVKLRGISCMRSIRRFMRRDDLYGRDQEKQWNKDRGR